MLCHQRIKSRLELVIALEGRLGIAGAGSFLTGIMANGPMPSPDISFQINRFVFQRVINSFWRERSFSENRVISIQNTMAASW